MKVLIDLDVLTIAESERRDGRKEKALAFLQSLEKLDVEVVTPTFILKQLKLWKNTGLVIKIVSRLFTLRGELTDPDDVEEVLAERTGKRLKEFAESGAKEIGTKASDFILVLYASAKEADHIVTFNKKHLKNKETAIEEFLKKYKLYVPKITLPSENLFESVGPRPLFKLPFQILPSKHLDSFSYFFRIFFPHIIEMLSKIFKFSSRLDATDKLGAEMWVNIP